MYCFLKRYCSTKMLKCMHLTSILVTIIIVKCHSHIVTKNLICLNSLCSDIGTSPRPYIESGSHRL